jgi:hypothetical protein
MVTDVDALADRLSRLEGLREGDRRDIERNEASQRWLWRTLGGAFLVIVAQSVLQGVLA